MANPTITSVSKDVKALHAKFDELLSTAEGDVAELVTPSFWAHHIGWAVACGACLVIGWMAHGIL